MPNNQNHNNSLSLQITVVILFKIISGCVVVPSVPTVSALGNPSFFSYLVLDMLVMWLWEWISLSFDLQLVVCLLVSFPTTLKHPLVKMCLKSSFQFSSLAGSFIGVGTCCSVAVKARYEQPGVVCLGVAAWAWKSLIEARTSPFYLNFHLGC